MMHIPLPPIGQLWKSTRRALLILIASALSALLAILLFEGVQGLQPKPYRATVSLITLTSRPKLEVRHTLTVDRPATALLTINVTGADLPSATIIADGGPSFRFSGTGKRNTGFPYAWALGPLPSGSVIPYLLVVSPLQAGPATLRISILTSGGSVVSSGGVTWHGVIRPQPHPKITGPIHPPVQRPSHPPKHHHHTGTHPKRRKRHHKRRKT